MEETPRVTFEIKQLDEKTFGLFINQRLLGTAKTHCDCDLVREIIINNYEKSSEVSPV